jgi:hypothetical protein
MYALQEIMDRVHPGNRGNIRPAEYFDVIGGVGTNGLAAMLFTRFVCAESARTAFDHSFLPLLRRLQLQAGLTLWHLCTVLPKRIAQ